MKLWLVGMMGSGKSEVGKRLATKLGARFVDLDAQLESEAGRPIARIFLEDGEPAFRKMEEAALAKIAGDPDAVIATGGGAVLSAANRAAMRGSGTVVWLDAPPAVLASRVDGDTSRPLLASGPAEVVLARIAKDRANRYREAAHARVPSEANADAVVEEVMAAAHGIGVTVPGGKDYRVRVGYGLLATIGETLRAALGNGGSKAVLVTDSNVGRRHGARAEKSLARAGWKTARITIPAGERHKTLATVAKIWDAAIAAGIDRRTPIVALGGGVVGDLAGFAAATLLRGVPLMQVPTTLVAAVDSAIGGKTGFDLRRGKNLVGSLKHPVAVVADLELLETLPRRELVAGMGEVVKYGAIADAALLERLRRPLAAELSGVVRRCVEIKAGVVSRDPEEQGERVVLNAGHTIGHALEAAGGFRRWRHGEAVAIGLVAETRFAEERGVCRAGEASRLAEVAAQQGLPVAAPRAWFRRAASFVAADKKRTGGELALPMLKEVGRVEVQRVPVVEVQRFVSKLS